MADDVSGVEVGTAYVTVLPSTRGFHKTLAADVDQASAKAGQSGGTAFAGSFTKALPAIGGALAAAFSAQKVLQFAGQSIDAASSLAEAQSKVTVVFGESAAAINRWAETSATDLLLSKQAALEAAGTYGNLFQAFGIGQAEATAMSTSLVQLAADLASFNNTSVEDALIALRSGLSGETEPLKRYGVALNDARLKAEAMAMGIYDGVGILDAAQKAQASYSLILKDTALAQGDVERTADGYANTMRAVDAAVENAKATIGEGLVDAIMAVNNAMGGTDKSVTMIDDLGSTVADFIAGFGAVIELMAEANPVEEKQAETIERVKTGWEGFFEALQQGDDPLIAIGTVWAWFGAQSRQAQADQEAWQETLASGGPMQDAYTKKVSAAMEATRDASVATRTYADYLASVQNTAALTAADVETLGEAMDRLNSRNGVRAAGVAIRDQWRALDTMGERVWRGKGKNRRQVQLDFDPTIVDGRFGTDESGDQARSWAVRMSELYRQKAEEKGGGVETERFLARAQKRLAGQFREWGVEDPMDYARSFLRTRADERARNQLPPGALDAARTQLGGFDESRRLGSRETNFIFNGDIKVDSDAALRQAAEEARRLVSLASRGAGPLAPVGALG